MLQDSAISSKSFALLVTRQLVAQHTQELVVKAEVDSEDKVELALPSALIEILSTSVELSLSHFQTVSLILMPNLENLLTMATQSLQTLFGWMTAFDFFTDAVSTFNAN